MIVSYKSGMNFDVTLDMQRNVFAKREGARRKAACNRIGMKIAGLLAGKVERLALAKHEVMGTLLETGKGLAQQYGCPKEHLVACIAVAAHNLTQRGVIPDLR